MFRQFIDAKDVVGTPAISQSEDVLFVPSSDDYIYALKKSTGKMIWSYETGFSIQAPPTITKDRKVLVPSSDKHLYAFDFSGTLLWKYKTQGWLMGPSVPLSDCTVVVGSRDKFMHAIGTCPNGVSIHHEEL